ncbi:MAG: TatD family hydrolase [Clostridiaceae bacterium]|nr:TatD family hydrolase [Clostridiaceae bacterium]
MEFFDSHSHYNDEKFDEDRDEIIIKTKEEGITKWICAGYDINSSKLSVKIAEKYPFIYSICGISPNDVPEKIEEIEGMIKDIEQLIQNDKNNRIVAIGEIGLDYYWNKENKEIQQEIFKKQIDLANKYNIPIVIHTREAVMDTIEILKNNNVNKRGIFHCCPLNRELVKEALKMDYYISFAGPITFKNSKNAKEIVEMVPLNRILIETDSPYLSPEPQRGIRNDSRKVKFVAEKIAEFKEITLEEVAKQTYKNALEVFNKISKK